MEDLPIKGWPLDVVPLLEDVVSEFIKPWRVDEFYIGRTTSISAAQSRHACDEIFALYETSSADNAIEVEDSLIQTFLNHPKCSNDADHGGGGWSDQYVHYVYLAIWYWR